MPTIWGGREHRVAQNLNTVIAKPAHMGSGLQHQAGAGPPRCRGSATPWLACPYGGGGTQCKGLLSQQMASQVGHYHPKFEGGKVVSAVVMPPQAHRELQGKQNKTKQNKTSATLQPEPAWLHLSLLDSVLYSTPSSIRLTAQLGTFCQGQCRRTV